MLGALCYICVPNIDKLTICLFQLELGEFSPGLEPLEFVSGECSSRLSHCEGHWFAEITTIITSTFVWGNKVGILTCLFGLLD